MSYPTLPEVKAYLSVSSPEDDDYIALVLSSVIGAVEQFCQRVFPEGEVTEEFFNKYDCRSLVLKKWPVSSIASFSVEGMAIAASDYNLHGEYGILYLNPTRSGDIEITYTGGYAELPAQIEYVIKDATKTVYENKDTDSSLGPIKSERIDGALTTSYFAPVDYMSSGLSVPKVLVPYVDLLKPFCSERSMGSFA